jgi:hypothetical protein
MFTGGSKDPLGKGLFYSLLLAAVVLTLFQRAFPSQDGPLHLYYSDVLANLLRGTGTYANDYQIKHLFPPYAFEPYFLVGLNMVFPPLLSEKLLVAAYIAWFCIAFRYLVQSVQPGNELIPLFALPLAVNRLLFLGFYNFSLGLATATFAMGFWLRTYDRPTWRRALAFLFLIVLVASMHPVALLPALMFVGVHLALAAAERFRAARGTVRDKAAAALAGSARPLACAVGAACTLGWIWAYTSPGKVSLFAPDPRRLKRLLSLNSINPFYLTGYRVVLSILVGFLLFAAVIALLRRRRGQPLPQLALPLMAAACAGLYVIVPWQVNSGQHFPDRFPIFALIFVAAAAARFRPGRQVERRLAVAAAVLVAICIGWQGILKHRILEEIRAVYEAPVPAGHLNAAVVASIPIRDRDRTEYSFLPDYWAGAHYVRRARAMFLNSAWLDAPIMMLKPRREEPCSYSDAFPMLQCLAQSRTGETRPDVLVAANGGGNTGPTSRLALSLGLVQLPVRSPVLQLYVRPDTVQSAAKR